MPRREPGVHRADHAGGVWLDAAVAVVLAAATVALYWRVRGFAFITYDDPIYVTGNAQVRAGLTRAGLGWAFTNFDGANWIPLTWLSLMLDAQVYGLAAGGFHLTNALWHALDAALLFAVLRRMTGARWPSAFVAAAFAVHPLQVESVAWITERKDVLSTCFWLLTMWCYAAYAARPAALRYGTTMALYALGLMAKPMLVSLPIVLLLLDRWPLARWQPGGGGRAAVRLGLEKLPLLGLAAAASLLTVLAQRTAGAVVPFETIPFSARIAHAIVSYAAYLGRLVWPRPLAVFYPLAGPPPTWQVIGSALLLALCSAAAVLAWQRRPYLSVGWGWFVITLAPVIGIVQVGEQATADRYTYVPMIGIAIAVAWGAAEIGARAVVPRAALAAIAVALLALWAVLAGAQLEYWRDSFGLYEHALAVTRDNYKAHLLLGNAYAARGDAERALPHLQRTVELRPAYSEARNNLANALTRLDRWSEALPHYAMVVAQRPDWPLGHNNFGFALERSGDGDAAIEHYEIAVRLDPSYGEAHFNLGESLSARGQLAAALPHFAAAARLLPTSRDARFALAVALGSVGDGAGAAREYETLLRDHPDDADAHYNLGNALLRSGAPADAAEHYRAALRLRPGWDAARENLDIALGAVDEARREGRREREQ